MPSIFDSGGGNNSNFECLQMMIFKHEEHFSHGIMTSNIKEIPASVCGNGVYFGLYFVSGFWLTVHKFLFFLGCGE